MLPPLHSGKSVTGRRGSVIDSALIEAVVAGIMIYYLCKWLDDCFESGDD